MRLLLIGPPGCGKGTQGVRVAKLYGLEHIAAGDILREHVANQTTTGSAVEAYLRAGRLVPDQIVLDTVLPRILAAARANGYVLDGFPRSVAQAAEVRRMTELTNSGVSRAVYLHVPAEQLRIRLLRRAKLQGRPDDTEAVITDRIRVFEEVTAPVLDFYRERNLLTSIEATAEPDRVTEQIVAALAGHGDDRPAGSRSIG